MKMRSKKRIVSLLGYFVFILTVAAIITVAIFVYKAAYRRFDGNDGILAVIMLLTVLFLAFVCVLIDGIRRKVMVNRPVNKILEATERITAGDFTVRLETEHPYGRYNEFDCIIDNLNRMTAELSKTEVLRTDFVSNVSHELKTPLAIIQNYSAAIQSDSLDRETQKKYASILVSTSKRLSELVTNILKLNRLENQEIKTEKKLVRLDEMLTDAVLQFEDKIEEKNLELDCDFEEISIVSDPNYLEIVWNNLISNAVKFTEEGGKVSVCLKRENGRAIVKVADTGCGMGKLTGEHIFDQFYQGDTSHAQEGNGLGLALVKKVMDILGGEISVESEVGKGSTFIVRLREEQ